MLGFHPIVDQPLGALGFVPAIVAPAVPSTLDLRPPVGPVTGDECLRMLQALLPPGSAYSREPDAVSTKALQGLAGEICRLHNRALDLLEEADPRTTREMITDWERATGLPDPCLDLAATLFERRQVLHHKWVNVGGQSIAFYIDVAARLGFIIKITEFRARRFGYSQHGTTFGFWEWQFVWRVDGPGLTFRWRDHGEPFGEPYHTASESILVCVIDRIKPAHTRVIYKFEEA